MVSTLKIYDILEQAQIDENNLEQSRVLATKEDIFKFRSELSEKIAETKTEIIRWMFLFWLGLIPVMAALIKFIH